ncbi:MAG: YraN family protein [Rhodocyclaceae bacterium]|nr:YraN family protein [Rhodocyclaceae bacterium]
MSTDAVRQRIGAAAEELAARHLLAHGLRIVERNFRVRGGEIDLIAKDGKTLVFVEVRLRSRSDFGGAAASITVRKQQRIILAATHYLQAHGEQACRFDAVLLDALDAGAVEWLKGAFSA